jgi:hypothetical protein
MDVVATTQEAVNETTMLIGPGSSLRNSARFFILRTLTAAVCRRSGPPIAQCFRYGRSTQGDEGQPIGGLQCTPRRRRSSPTHTVRRTERPARHGCSRWVESLQKGLHPAFFSPVCFSLCPDFVECPLGPTESVCKATLRTSEPAVLAVTKRSIAPDGQFRASN